VDRGAVDVDCKGVDEGNAFVGACVIAVGHRAVEEGLKTINEGCNDIDGGRGAMDEGLDAVDEGDDTVVDSCNSVESRNAVCEDNILAGVRAIDVDHKAGIGRGSGVADSWWRLEVELEE